MIEVFSVATRSMRVLGKSSIGANFNALKLSGLRYFSRKISPGWIAGNLIFVLTCLLHLMVINNFYFAGPSICPNKTNLPLPVYAG